MKTAPIVGTDVGIELGSAVQVAHTAKNLLVSIQGSPPKSSFIAIMEQLFIPIQAAATTDTLDRAAHDDDTANEEQSVPSGVPYEAKGIADITCPGEQMRDRVASSPTSP